MDLYGEDEDEIDIQIRRARENPAPFYRYVQQPARRGSGFAQPPRGVRRSSTLEIQADDQWPGTRRREGIRAADIDNRDEEFWSREREAEAERFRARPRRSRSPESPQPSPPAAPVIIRERDERERRHANYFDNSDYGSDSDTSRRLHRRRNQRTRFSPEAIVVEEEDLKADAYSFTFSRHTQSVASRNSTEDSVSDVSENDTPDPPSQGKTIDPIEGKVLRVFQSQYTGDGVIGGFQTVELTVKSEDSRNSRKGPQPLFRWVQFEDLNMNLDKFESGCAHISGLTDSEKTIVQRLFSRVRRKFDKVYQTSGGTKASFMVPSVVRESGSGEPLRRSPTSGVEATWMCLPYFCLQRYSGVSSGLHPSSHPIRTLLQTRFASVKKERDMQQAVCRLPSTPAEHCFHIAQVWCIILNDSLVITCSRTPVQQSLLGKAMFISTGPNPPIQAGIKTGRLTHLLVKAGKYLHWSIPIEECQSWFGFLSHFWEFWPRQLEFCYNGKAIIPALWPKLYTHASRTNACITLDVKSRIKEPARGVILATDYVRVSDDSSSDSPAMSPDERSANERPVKLSNPVVSSNEATGIPQASPSKEVSEDSSRLQPGTASKDEKIAKTSTRKGGSGLESEFHLFTWMNEVDATSISISDPKIPQVDSPTSANIVELNLKNDLGEMDEFLRHQTGFRGALAYKACPQNTRREVYDLLSSKEKEVTTLVDSDSNRRSIFELQVGFVNTAETLFTFFLPSHFEGPTVAKFWGAIYSVVNSLSLKTSDFPEEREKIAWAQRKRRTTANLLLRWLEIGLRDVQYFKEILSYANPSDRSAIDLPEDLSKAWLHLLMCLAFAIKDKYVPTSEEHGLTYGRLLDEGMRKVMSSLEQTSLLGRLVLLPNDLTKFINLALLGDITASTSSQHLDIHESYLEYLNILEIEMERKPLDRGHQDKITRFKQEMVVIAETLSMQSRILYGIQQLSEGGEKMFRQREPPRLAPSATDPIAMAYQAGKMDTGAERLGGYRHTAPPPVGPRASQIHRTYQPQGAYYPTYEPAASHSHPIERERAFQSYFAEERPPPAYAPNPYTSAYVPEGSQILGSQLDPTDPSGIQGMLLQDSQAIISQKFRGFIELYDRASELEIWNIQKIDYNKDRQESAIYAFTVVTIIFLPLSTVAGILGMNVNDVRNMELNQWVFWVTAIPLTFIIITLCLVWAGEFGNFWGGFSNLWKGKKERVPVPERGYYGPMQDSTSIMAPRMEPLPIRRERYDALYGRRRAPTHVEYGDF